MEEQLQQIKARLLNSEYSFPILQERLLRSGELRAWFKYYNGPNQWQNRFYQEEHVFLLEQVLIVACLYTNGKLSLRTFRLDEISRIERDYDFAAKDSKDLVLSKVTITFKRTVDKKRPDCLVFTRPRVEEQGDPIGYEKLVDLLD